MHGKSKFYFAVSEETGWSQHSDLVPDISKGAGKLEHNHFPTAYRGQKVIDVQDDVQWVIHYRWLSGASAGECWGIRKGNLQACPVCVCVAEL